MFKFVFVFLLIVAQDYTSNTLCFVIYLKDASSPNLFHIIPLWYSLIVFVVVATQT